MKTSVISDEFRERYLANPLDPDAFEGRAMVFDGPEDYHARIDDPALELDEDTVLVIRGVGPIGYPGAAEVVNMRSPDYLLKRGIHGAAVHRRRAPVGDVGQPVDPQCLPGGCDRRRPGAAADRRPGAHRSRQAHGRHPRLRRRARNATRRRSRRRGGFKYPESQTPWQEIQRGLVDELSHGMVLKPAVKYQRIAETKGVPRRQPLTGRFKYAYNSFSYYGEEIERSIERVAAVRLRRDRARRRA